VLKPPASRTTTSAASRPVSPAALSVVKNRPTPGQPCDQVVISAAASSAMAWAAPKVSTPIRFQRR
jgi:hypothetical protein